VTVTVFRGFREFCFLGKPTGNCLQWLFYIIFNYYNFANYLHMSTLHRDESNTT